MKGDYHMTVTSPTPSARAAFSCLALLSCAAPLFGALGGVPERPIPGRPWPTVWTTLANDDFGGDFTGSDDDYRTAALNAGVRIGRVIAFADYGMLTVRDEDIRTDELTFSVGGLLLHEDDLDLGPSWEIDLAIGLGHRIIGDLGGSDIQNDWHDAIGVDLTYYSYEDDEDETLGWLNAEATWKSVAGERGWRFGASATLRALSSFEGVAKISPAIHLMASHGDKDFWLGLRQELRTGGDAPTRTQDLVREQEDGTWITYGIRPWKYIYLSGSFSLDNNGKTGAIGFVWPPPERAGDVRVARRANTRLP
jgi:hypothetical protein